MQLTRQTEYAMLGLIYLSRKRPAQSAMLREISAAWGLPEKFLAKIFQKLSRAGILESNRGAQGGFKLARPAAEITLHEVIETIEGPFALNWCLEHDSNCEQFQLCGLQAVLNKAQQRMRDVFMETTLADLCSHTVTHPFGAADFQSLHPTKTTLEFVHHDA